MTKRELINFLSNVSDDTEIKLLRFWPDRPDTYEPVEGIEINKNGEVVLYY